MRVVTEFLFIFMMDEIVLMQTFVLMFVYIETASAVKRRQPGGRVKDIKMGLRASLLLK